MSFSAFLSQLLSPLMTSAAQSQTSWLGGCRSWSSAASWAPPQPGCLCLRRAALRLVAAPAPVTLAFLATAPAPLIACPAALWAPTAAQSWLFCLQMQVWPQTATATAAPAPAPSITAGPSKLQTSLSCRPLHLVWGHAPCLWMLNSAPCGGGGTEEVGPYSVLASLLPPPYLTRSPSLLAHLGHNTARRPHSPAPAQPPVTAPVTARAATARSRPREPLSPGHRQRDAASDPSGQDLILATGFKVRCELIPA